MQETLELQKLRKRAHGVNAVTLAIGKKVSKVDELVSSESISSLTFLTNVLHH
jgi:hypothetical protein